MPGRWWIFSLTLAMAISVPSDGQSALARAPGTNDYAQEAAVIEEMSTKIAFDNDGNFTREQTSRIHVHTDAGVKQWGLLAFPFQSSTQAVEIDYVRVRKIDGSNVVTPPDNIQDLDSELTRSAPFYSDLREKHVAVKGLGKGDILEYSARWRTTKTLIPGQFWFQYSFHHDGIVLDERVEVKVPAGRTVKFKGPLATQTITADAGSPVYAWTYSRLQSAKEPGSDEKTQIESARGILPPPDVQISSFQSWEEVGRWYWNLQKERTDPSPAIRAKAEELTKGMTDDSAKLRALYSFVSTQYRYIGIAFGIGRYQPHAADDVLTNNYGDCKDKHTLLASLLQASGITLYPALINSTFGLDPEVPSPAQFDHIIGYLPPGKDNDNHKDKSKDALWLDTTAEIAPLGYLVQRLRDKPALVMSGDNSIRLITTPADPPFPSSQTFKIDARLNGDGTLDAKVEDMTRGESEVYMRAAFREVPQPQWKDLVQQISYRLGYAGTVSDAEASTPEAISEPFHFSYSYSRKDYPDWSNHQFSVPGLPFYMPPLQDDSTRAIWLGTPMEMVSDSKVSLPPGYKPKIPSNVDLKYDFAEYHASYSKSEDQGALLAKRRLLIKLHEVPVADFADYKSFVKNLQNDVNQYVQTSSSASEAANTPLSSFLPSAPPPGKTPSLLSDAIKLPGSNSSKATQLETDAYSAVRRGDHSAALSAFKGAVEADPTFMRARLELAAGYIAEKQYDSAREVLLKAIESDPRQMLARRAYASVLVALHRTDEAIEATREAVRVAPEDPQPNEALGSLLLGKKRYSEALPYLETAAKGDHSQSVQTQLGSAYLRSGQVEKGAAILQKVIEADSTPMTLNNIAYDFAEANADLPKALEFAQRAVDEQEKDLHNVELSNLLSEDLLGTQRLGYLWDTLGWIHFRLGHLDQAESYVRASWTLSQFGVVGDHLGQIYEQQKKTQEAIHMYRLALATPEAHSSDDTWDETRHRLEQLTGDKVPTAPGLLRWDSSADELSELRSVKIKRPVAGPATAEFFLLFVAGPKIEDVKFISGSKELEPAGHELSEASFRVALPQGSSARVVRRAILTCSNAAGCTAVLLTPDVVNSVN